MSISELETCARSLRPLHDSNLKYAMRCACTCPNSLRVALSTRSWAALRPCLIYCISRRVTPCAFCTAVEGGGVFVCLFACVGLCSFLFFGGFLNRIIILGTFLSPCRRYRSYEYLGNFARRVKLLSELP